MHVVIRILHEKRSPFFTDYTRSAITYFSVKFIHVFCHSNRLYVAETDMTADNSNTKPISNYSIKSAFDHNLQWSHVTVNTFCIFVR